MTPKSNAVLAIEDLLDTIEKLSADAGEVGAEIAEATDAIERPVSKALSTARLARRGYQATSRLMAEAADGRRPGTLRLAVEGWNLLFGDDGEKKG